MPRLPPAFIRRPSDALGSVLWSMKVASSTDSWIREYAKANSLSLAYAVQIAVEHFRNDIEAKMAALPAAKKPDGPPSHSGPVAQKPTPEASEEISL